jgi:hypothetical protein
MAVRIVQFGSPRASGEGLRIGTVRRPPSGVGGVGVKATLYTLLTLLIVKQPSRLALCQQPRGCDPKFDNRP